MKMWFSQPATDYDGVLPDFEPLLTSPSITSVVSAFVYTHARQRARLVAIASYDANDPLIVK